MQQARELIISKNCPKEKQTNWNRPVQLFFTPVPKDLSDYFQGDMILSRSSGEEFTHLGTFDTTKVRHYLDENGIRNAYHLAEIPQSWENQISARVEHCHTLSERAYVWENRVKSF